LRNASQKNCWKIFAPGPATTFSAFAGMANSRFTNAAAASRKAGSPGDGQ
jgi:hypothetical protein